MELFHYDRILHIEHNTTQCEYRRRNYIMTAVCGMRYRIRDISISPDIQVTLVTLDRAATSWEKSVM